MTPSAILACYLALAALDLGWAVFLTVLNCRRVSERADQVPGPLVGAVSPGDAAKAASYSLARMRLSLVQTPLETAIVVAAAALGLFGLLDRLESGLAVSVFWRGAIYLGSVGLAGSLLSTPFDLYSTFFLERRFGFNATSARTWLLDRLRGLLLTVAIGLPLLFLVYAFIDGTGRLWWLWAALAYSLFNLFVSWLYPLAIAPLFNKFSPLPDGSLKERIGELARALDFKVGGVFTMDSSRRSRHSNAYFTGFGGVKRVVLFDTLLAGTPEDEILAIVAHEIGHEKKRHVLKGTAASVAFSFLVFWVLSLMMGWAGLYAAFGFSGPSKHALLLILGLVSGPATFFLTPAFAAWSRRREYQADAYAADAVGAGAVASSLVRLGRENASNLWPHPLYSAWYYSHPALVERLAALKYPT